MKVDVRSAYNHEAAPVPGGARKVQEADTHQHGHNHHDHEHFSAVDKGSKEDPHHNIGDEHNHSHGHSHDHGHSRSHDHSRDHSHDPGHNHDHQSSVSASIKYMRNRYLSTQQKEFILRRLRFGMDRPHWMMM
jgi:hypothetical protein